MYPSSLPASHVLAGFSFSVAFSLIGILLNAVTLYALLTCSKLRAHSTTYFVVSLTVSDLLFCGVTLPITADTLRTCGICRVDAMCK